MKIESVLYSRHRQNERATKILSKTAIYHDLTFVLRGELEYSAGSRALPLQSGDVLFLPPGILRERKESQKPADYISFNFIGENLPSLPLVIQGGVSREILFLLSAFDEGQKESYLPNTEEKTKHLIAMLLYTLKDQITARESHPLVQKIIAYLHQNLAEKISLETVAAGTYFSPIYCETIFQKETGKAIIDYLIDLRVDTAKLLLAQGFYSMEEIARMTGFSDGNYFSRMFKKRTGHTPSGYRKLFVPDPKIG